MKQWDTFDFEFEHGLHPCVILSRTARCQNPAFETVNILSASSHRATRLPLDHEFILDAADGMDWETLVRLDFVWTARKTDLKRQRKEVSSERRRALGAKLIRWFGLLTP